MPAGPPPVVNLATAGLAEMSENERIKLDSRGLFFLTDKAGTHTFLDEVQKLDSGEEPTISSPAKELSKFFGIYKQQGRGERGRKTHDYFFMVRIKKVGAGWGCGLSHPGHQSRVGRQNTAGTQRKLATVRIGGCSNQYMSIL